MQKIDEQQDFLFCVKINGEKKIDPHKNPRQLEIRNFLSTTIINLEKRWKDIGNENLGIKTAAEMFKKLLENKKITSNKNLAEFITDEIKNSIENMIQNGDIEKITDFSAHKNISDDGKLSLYPLQEMNSKKSPPEETIEELQFSVGIPVFKDTEQETASIMEEVKTILLQVSSKNISVKLAVNVFPLQNVSIPYRIDNDPLNRKTSDYKKVSNQKIQNSNYIIEKNYVNQKIPIVTYVTKNKKIFAIDRCQNYRFHLKSGKIERADFLPIQKHATHSEKHELTRLDHFCFLRNLDIKKNSCVNSQVIDTLSNIIYNTSQLKLKNDTFKITSIYLF